MNNVKHYRKKSKLTQEEVADRIGISVSYLSMIENGKANLTEDKMRKFSELFGVSVARIFFADVGK